MPCYPTGFEHSAFEPESWTQEIIVTYAKGSRRSQGLHLPTRAVRDSFVIDLRVDLQMAMLAWQTLINFLYDWSDNRFADLQMAMLAWQTLINSKMWRNSFSGGILTTSAFKISSVPATCSVRWLSESKRLRFLLLEMTVGYSTIEESWN